MNHCLLEVEVIQAPTIRYTQDNKTPIAEMDVSFDGLRNDDPSSQIKVVGWGNLAQELQNRVQVGQRLVVEGRLRMNTVPRQDGTKEKRAEFTLSKMHSLEKSATNSPQTNQVQGNSLNKSDKTSQNQNQTAETVSWNSSPLIPDTDDIPF